MSTEREREQQRSDERWQLALNGLQEVSGQYRELLKSVQTGFSFLSGENAAIERRLALIEAKVQAMDASFQQLLPHLASIAAYAVTQQRHLSPQPRQRPSRRPNGE